MSPIEAQCDRERCLDNDVNRHVSEMLEREQHTSEEPRTHVPRGGAPASFVDNKGNYPPSNSNLHTDISENEEREDVNDAKTQDLPILASLCSRRILLRLSTDARE